MADYCFHSFPRPRKNESREAQFQKGEKIARSLIDNGLLLVPEHFEIPLLDGSGVQVDKLEVTQCRICFTEIPASDLPAHSERFGPFALAYDLDDLRRIGALPVHYVPLPQGTHLYGLGSQIIAGVADAVRAIEALTKIRSQIERSPTFGMELTRKIDGKDVRDGVRFNEEQTTILRSFFDEFEKMCSMHLGLTHQKLLAAAACFYPTEHPTRTGKLHYYRQREWRVVECGLMANDEPLAPRADDRQKETLRAIDNEFFSKQVQMPSSSGRIGEWELVTIADRCRFLSRIDDLDVVGLAKFLVVPDGGSMDSAIVKTFRERGVAVVTRGTIPSDAS